MLPSMTADPADPYLGRVIAEKFRIDSQLGIGSVGTVYRATHLQLNRTVALKVLRASLASEPGHVERFTREARLASQLDHPNVVHVYDYGTDAGGLTYLAMEFAEGSDLAAVIDRESPLAPARVVALLAQVLSALVAAHRLGIVHRDLKPENILVVSRPGDDGRDVETAKVADFGIAKVYGDTARASEAITRFGSANGTPEYMSPEQALAQELDGRSDVYACGVMLYEMLAGRPPFVGETPLEVVEQHVRDAPAPPSKWRADVDPRLATVAMRALEKDRADRYADAAEMRAALLAALEQPMPAGASPGAGPAPSVLIESGPSESIEIAADPPPRADAAPSVLLELGESLEAPADVRPTSTREATAAAAERPAVPREARRASGTARALIAVVAVTVVVAGAAASAWWLMHRDRGGRAVAGHGAERGDAAAVTAPSAGDAGAPERPPVRRRRLPVGHRGGAPSVPGH
jgi:serine/threonine-protein kinase